MKEGFWGLPSPTGTGKAKAHVLGPPGPFFRGILKASRYVELYDDILGYEPWRRGVATAVASPGRAGEVCRKAGTPFVCLAGYRRLPRGLGASPSIRLLPGARMPKRIPRDAALLVIDPLVMDVTVMGLRKNSPGGLAWYPLLDLLAACFEDGCITVVHLLPQPLPRRDEYPAFVLARLVSHLLALALRRGGGAGR